LKTSLGIGIPMSKSLGPCVPLTFALNRKSKRVLHSASMVNTRMNHNQHIKTTQIAALDAWCAITPETPQTMLGKTKKEWRALNTECCWAITEDKLAGGN
jgi:hypothetical protein